jgi:poly(3-hydroxybutyrate) depolymerase
MLMPLSPSRWILAALISASLAACSSQAQAPALPSLSIDPDRVAVVGLSSGAYMATQAHLALSDRIQGAALIAGGPYGCAGGDLGTALGPCISAEPAAPDVPALLAEAQRRSEAGVIAPLSNLANDRVLVLHGAQDIKVAPAVGGAAVGLYRALADLAPGLEVSAELEGPYGHLLSLPGSGDECADPKSPFIGRCGFDAPGAVFKALFGEAPAPAAAAAAGELRSFNQDALTGEGPATQLAETGYVYVPPQCAGDRCGLLVAFHGCEQNADKIGEALVRDGGFNTWADAYGVVVLYPQTRASFAPLNPKACWDWWGYTGADYDTRSGAQLQWLARALDALGA